MPLGVGLRTIFGTLQLRRVERQHAPDMPLHPDLPPFHTATLTHTTQAAASAISFAFTTPATQALAAASSATALGAALAAPAAATNTSTLAARAAGRGTRMHVPIRDASRKPTDAASSRTTLTFAAASLALALAAAATTLAAALTATFHAGQHHLPRYVRRQCVHRLWYQRDRLLRRPAL